MYNFELLLQSLHMKRVLFFITFLASLNTVCGQINVLDLSNKKDLIETIAYDDHVIQINLTNTNPNKAYFHSLQFWVKDIKKCPLNDKIKVNYNGDTVSCSYDYRCFTDFDKNIQCRLFDGDIEFLDLTDSTFTMNLNLFLLDDKGKTLKYVYKGQRSGKTVRIPTQEELTAKLLPLGLDSLIKRFDTDWQLKETGKAYWIGYTDEMYAIASNEDAAINKLVDYINSTHNLHGRIGAVYCLHLIGIDSKVVGRYVEKFVNTNARNALLSLINQQDLTDLIISLLARDPWQSDLPVLSQMLKSGTNKTLINALFRYWIDARDEIPFRDSISTSTKAIQVFFNDSLGFHELGDIITVYQETEDENPELATNATKGFKSGDRIDLNYSDGYTNKANMLNQNGDVFMQFGKRGIRTVRKFIPRKDAEKIIKKIVDCSTREIGKGRCDQLNQLFSQFFDLSQVKVDISSYFDLWESMFHYMRAPDEMVICDLEVARQRWLQLFKAKGL